jgi:small subunit ribosomal protein S21
MVDSLLFFYYNMSTFYEKEVNRVTSVVLRPNESQDQLLKRFRKKVAKSGVLSTVRRKRWYVSKSELRRIQKKKAARRVHRRNYSAE